MANETPRMKITYPAIGEANYFDNYQAGMNDIDAGIFAAWSAINTIASGGGTLTWDLVGSDYTLTWTSLIAFHTPAFGSTQSIASGSVIIPQGLSIYTDIAFGATAGSTALTFTVASQLPVDTASLAFAWHNPTTNQLHFATGLVIALGGSATGVQPQGGGGGGSITVTDGSTTVNPASTITFTGGSLVADLGGGNAEVTAGPPVAVGNPTVGYQNPTNTITLDYGIDITAFGGGTVGFGASLFTQFVVSKDDTTKYKNIQDAIDAAFAAYGATGEDQIVFVRAGTYTETLTFMPGVRVIAESNPEAKRDYSWIGTANRSPVTAVIVDGYGHTFDTAGATERIRSTIQGITFANAGQQLFTVLATYGSENTIQFFDCLLLLDSAAGNTLIEVNGKNCPNLSLHCERCRFVCLPSSAGNWDAIMLLGSNGGDQFYTFVDCEFDTKGYTGSVVFESNSGTGAGECRLTRCTFNVCDLRNGDAYNPFNADLWLTDTVIDYPQRYPVVWNTPYSVYVKRCTLGASMGGQHEPVYTGGQGYLILDNMTYYPSYVTGTTRIADAAAVATTAVAARSVEGGTYTAGGVGTIDLDALWIAGYNYTNVSWDTTIGGAGTRTVQLHDAAKTQGMYFTVWDSGASGGSRNITVTSPATAGGVVGPHTSIVHNSGSLTFVATIDENLDPCWRSISYFH